MSDAANYRRAQRKLACMASVAARNSLAGLAGYVLPTVPDASASVVPAGLSRRDLTTAA